MDVFDAAIKYKEEASDLVVIAGKDYGSGSSRDWAAKGPWILVSSIVNDSSSETVMNKLRVSAALWFLLHFFAAEYIFILICNSSNLLAKFVFSWYCTGEER